MFEIDFLPVGDGARSGDAIAMRFTRPDNNETAHVIIDGGFQDDGEALVDHVTRVYGTDHIDLVVLTHPDKDHIGGLGKVLEGLNVDCLAAHDLGARGGGSLKAAEAVAELRDLAREQGASLYEPFAGLNAFGEALLIAGPSEAFYEAQVAAEVAQERAGTRASAPATRGLAATARGLTERALSRFPVELPFGDAGGDNPRNNSSAIIDLRLGNNRFLFTGDAGVPALDGALDYLDGRERNDRYPTLVQLPHHGSRHNGSRDLVERMAGPHTDSERGHAYVSISEEAAKDPRYPSPRIANAFGRRGYQVATTAGKGIFFIGDGATRNGAPLTVLPPLDESIDDRP